jgi:hypothetical protein
MEKLTNMGANPTILLHKTDVNKMIFTGYCEKNIQIGQPLFCNVGGTKYRGFIVSEILENGQHKGFVKNEKAFWRLKVTTSVTYFVQEKDGKIHLETKDYDEAKDLFNKPYHIHSSIISRCNITNDIIEKLSHDKKK